MDIFLEKQKIKDQVDLISNETILQYISSVVNRMSKGLNLDPHTEDGLNKRLEQSMQDLENGTTISSEAMRERVKQWKK